MLDLLPFKKDSGHTYWTFHHRWEHDGKQFEADFEIEAIKYEGKILFTVDQIKGRNAAECLFNEKYEEHEVDKLKQDLIDQDLAFVKAEIDLLQKEKIEKGFKINFLTKRFSTNVILYAPELKMACTQDIQEECYPAIRFHYNFPEETETFNLLASEIGEYEEYKTHPDRSLIISDYLGGRKNVEKLLIKQYESNTAKDDLQAVFTTNNGYDSIYVPDGTFLSVDPETLKDFIEAENDPFHDFYDWHGKERWDDKFDTLEEAVRNSGDIVVALYRNNKLIITDKDEWEIRKDFYRIEEKRPSVKDKIASIKQQKEESKNKTSEKKLHQER